MGNEISSKQRAFIESALKLAKIYHVRIIRIITTENDILFKYGYDEKSDFDKFMSEIEKLYKKFGFTFLDEDKAESYTM